MTGGGVALLVGLVEVVKATVAILDEEVMMVEKVAGLEGVAAGTESSLVDGEVDVEEKVAAEGSGSCFAQCGH